MQNTDGADTVLVNRIDMIHVVLHLRDDTTEIRHEAAEHPGLVQTPECRLRIFPGRQHLDKQTVCLRIVANAVYRMQIPRNRPQCLRVDIQLCFLRGMEQTQNSSGFLADFAAAHGQPAALDIETVDRFLEQPQRRQPEPGFIYYIFLLYL